MVKLYKYTLLFLVLACTPTVAEQLMQISPEMRLRHGEPDTGLASQNVTVAPIDPNSLPDYIKEGVKGMLAMCTGSINQMNNVRAYSWTSDRHANKGLPPNYIIDYGAIKDKPDAQHCEQGPICNDEGCLVIGYTPIDASTWKQDFNVRAKNIGFNSVAASDTITRMEIDILSNKPDCKKQNGFLTSQGCYRRLAWRNFGLTVLPPPQQQ